MTKDERRRILAGRLAYKPGYEFVLGPGSVQIETRRDIPCADQSIAGVHVKIPDAWSNENVDHDTSYERGAVLASLEAALTCAIHETLEWFSLDGVRLVAAHSSVVEAQIEDHVAALAAWCWRNRGQNPGAARPERAA